MSLLWGAAGLGAQAGKAKEGPAAPHSCGGHTVVLVLYREHSGGASWLPRGWGVWQGCQFVLHGLWEMLGCSRIAGRLKWEGPSGGHPIQPLLKQGHLRQVAQDHVQAALEDLPGG